MSWQATLLRAQLRSRLREKVDVPAKPRSYERSYVAAFVSNCGRVASPFIAYRLLREALACRATDS